MNALLLLKLSQYGNARRGAPIPENEGSTRDYVRGVAASMAALGGLLSTLADSGMSDAGLVSACRYLGSSPNGRTYTALQADRGEPYTPSAEDIRIFAEARDAAVKSVAPVSVVVTAPVVKATEKAEAKKSAKAKK